jgi:hypothetical protein
MTKDFHERFEISIPVEEAKRRFIKRANNMIFDFFHSDIQNRPYLYDLPRDIEHILNRLISYRLGENYLDMSEITEYIKDDFFKCLQALEAFYQPLNNKAQEDLNSMIEMILADSEVDLGIRWEAGRFVPAGARLLDDKLVNDPLRWLRDEKYKAVLIPYEKGLNHFLQTDKQPQLLADVITDMYEALEALSKIITGRETKDLSANGELLLTKVKASNQYKSILKGYIAYANKYRHAVADPQSRPALSKREVESFIYLTGIFIRLAA